MSNNVCSNWRQKVQGDLSEKTEALFREISVLRDSNVHIVEQRETLNRKAKELLEQRNQKNEEFKRLIAEVKTLKARRDELNRKVKELKGSRNVARDAAVAERERLEKLRNRSDQLSERIDGNPRRAVEEFNRLEWKMQTTTLTPKAEKELIKRLKELEAQVLVAKRAEALRDKILGTKATIGGRRLQAQSYHEQMTKVVEESEVIHKKLVEVAAAASAAKDEADNAHAAFVEALKGADNAHKEYVTNLVKIREIRQLIAQSGPIAKLRKGQEVREKLEKSGAEKLEQGKRLSLEEFKALMEKGAI
jgi:uncharacterized coiled-coil DUF342 family protein